MTFISFYDENQIQTNDDNDHKKTNNRFKYNYVKTISIKKFLADLGKDFSPHVKEQLMKLEMRTVLTRLENMNVLDIKHVEHEKYPVDCGGSVLNKEHVFGQLVTINGNLYFAKSCIETDKATKFENIDKIYDSLTSSELLLSNMIPVKKIDDENIDFFIDGLLDCIPDVSERYLKILKEMKAYRK